MKGKIRIGTSGWHYKHWSGNFYPKDLKPCDFLKYYSEKFDTVEINNSFYRLPTKNQFKQWKNIVPGKFKFAVKANRYITHIKKLKDSKKPVENFLKNTYELRSAMGPVLFQLPPRFGFNKERFRSFTGNLPGSARYAFEFRDRSWITKSALDILINNGHAFCIYHLAGFESPHEVTADFVYIRLHGTGEKYRGSYDIRTLRRWSENFRLWSENGKDIYCYFNNDDSGYAPKNALAIKEMLEI